MSLFLKAKKKVPMAKKQEYATTLTMQKYNR